jgi:hypothetical protein
MRLTKDYCFDIIELVGKAVSTARMRRVTAKDIESLAPPWLRAILEALRPPPPERKPGQDEFGLFEDSPWEGQYQEDSARTDLSSVVRGAEDFQTSPVEEKVFRREWDIFGDSVSCRLWEIQRRLRFKIVGVQDTLKDLAELCRGLPNGYISKGWGNRLIDIIDAHSRG